MVNALGQIIFDTPKKSQIPNTHTANDEITIEVTETAKKKSRKVCASPYYNILSLCSCLSGLSICSVLGFFSLLSVGSFMSTGSAFSVLSSSSIGSILSTNSILAFNCTGKILKIC